MLGKVGWVGALAALGGAEPFRWRQRLHALERRELLRRERRSAVAGERQYAFRHVLVRDVAYGQLPRAARADRHQRAARWLEALAPDRAEDRAELLAHHWQAALQYAQPPAKTALLAEQARLALREAATGPWSSTPSPPPPAGMRPPWSCGRPAMPSGRGCCCGGQARVYGEQAGGELLVEARDGLLAQGDREAAAEAEALLSMLAVWQVQGERAMQHARRAVALWRTRGRHLPRPMHSPASPRTSCFGPRLRSEAIQVGRQALRMADRLGLHRDRVGALQAIGPAGSLAVTRRHRRPRAGHRDCGRAQPAGPRDGLRRPGELPDFAGAAGSWLPVAGPGSTRG